MSTTRHRQREISDEVRILRKELRQIAESLDESSDKDQRAAADKKLTELEKRIDSLEAQTS